MAYHGRVTGVWRVTVACGVWPAVACGGERRVECGVTGAGRVRQWRHWWRVACHCQCGVCRVAQWKSGLWRVTGAGVTVSLRRVACPRVSRWCLACGVLRAASSSVSSSISLSDLPVGRRGGGSAGARARRSAPRAPPTAPTYRVETGETPSLLFCILLLLLSTTSTSFSPDSE